MRLTTQFVAYTPGPWAANSPAALNTPLCLAYSLAFAPAPCLCWRMNDAERELALCRAVREATDAFSFVRALNQLSVYLVHEWEIEQAKKAPAAVPLSIRSNVVG